MNLTASVSLLILGVVCGCYTAFRYSKRVRELCAMETFFTRIYAELSLEQTATAALFAKLSMQESSESDFNIFDMSKGKCFFCLCKYAMTRA